MRTVWTMGFVAAAALSFCFPDFMVFRFTQAAIWALALLGLVLLCGVSGQFSFAQAALFGMGAYSAALSRRISLCRSTARSSWRLWSATRQGMGWGGWQAATISGRRR
jgi:ABC-type branched-subunit amino acid transport system permease subunit